MTLVPGAKTIEWDVQLHGIPIAGDEGKEIVVNW